MEERTTYCITNWDAVLRVNRIHQPERKFKIGLVDVSDPNARDAGMVIGMSEIKALIHVKPLTQQNPNP